MIYSIKIVFSVDTTHVFRRYISNEQLECGYRLVALVSIITSNCGKNSEQYNIMRVVRHVDFKNQILS